MFYEVWGTRMEQTQPYPKGFWGLGKEPQGGSVVEPGFNFQHPRGGSQSPPTPDPGNLILSYGFHRH